MSELSSSSSSSQDVQNHFSLNENEKTVCNHCGKVFESHQTNYKKTRHLATGACIAARSVHGFVDIERDADSIESRESSSSDSVREDMESIDSHIQNDEPYQDQLDAAEFYELRKL